MPIDREATLLFAVALVVVWARQCRSNIGLLSRRVALVSIVGCIGALRSVGGVLVGVCGSLCGGVPCAIVLAAVLDVVFGVEP